MMKHRLLVWLFCFAPLYAWAQNISGFEYFFETDPGFGKGVAINITAGNDVSHEITLDVNHLSNGIHAIGIRAKDENGVWGMATWHYFHKMTLAQGAATNIIAAEYSFDTDPGYGKGTALAFTAGTDVELTTTLDVTSLSDGFHLLFYRVKDVNQTWGPTYFSSFIKQKIYSANDLKIVGAEYFINNELGFGKGIPIPVTEGLDVTIAQDIDISGLPDGIHFVYTRVKYADNTWGHTERKAFIITNGIPASANLISGEYFFDTDPGVGLAKAFTYTEGADIDAQLSFPTTGLASGHHVLYTRVQDAQGNWSQTHAKRFFIQPEAVVPAPAQSIIAAEYFFDTDPGTGKATRIATDALADLNANLAISTTGLAAGFHTLYIRTQDSKSQWSVPQARRFYVQPATVPPPAQAELLKGEYFFGKDPGIGKANPFVFTAGSTIDFSGNYSLAGFKVADTSINYRVVDAAGQWSTTATHKFKITDCDIPVSPSTFSGAKEVCQGTTSTVFSLTATTFSTSYMWYAEPSTAVSNISVSGTNATLTWNKSYYGKVKLFAKGKNTCTEGNWSSGYEVNIIALPTVPKQPQGPTTLCANLGASIFTTSATDASTYTWTLSNSAAGNISQANATGTLTWAGGFSGSLTVKVLATNLCGSSAYSPALSLTVRNLPKNMGVTGSNELCFNPSNAEYIAGGTMADTYNWSVLPAESAVLFSAETNKATYNWNDTYHGNVKIKVSGQNECGTSAQDAEISVNIRKLPPQATAPQGETLFCKASAPLNYTAAAVGDATSYTWKISPAEAGTLSVNNQTATVTWAAGYFGNVSLQTAGVNVCGTGELSTELPIVIETIADKPSLPTGETNICAGAKAIYSTTAAANATSYNWYASVSNSLTVADHSLSPEITWRTSALGNINVYVKGNNTCGEGPASDNLMVLVKAIPQFNIAPTGNNKLCNGETIDYTVQANEWASTYNWSVSPPEAGTMSGTGTTGSFALNKNYVGDASIKVTGTNNCGTGNLSPGITVSISKIPDAPNQATGTQTLCLNSGNTQYSINAVTLAETYNWLIEPQNAAQIATNGNLLAQYAWSNTFTGTAGIKVNAQNYCGTSAYSNPLSIIVNVLPIPQTLTGPAEVCTNQMNAMYSVHAFAGNTYAWQIQSGEILSGANTYNPTVKWNSGTGKLTLTETITATGCKLETVFPVTLKAVEAPVLAEIKLKGGYILIYKGMELDGYQWYYNGNKVEGAVKQYYVAPTGSRNGNYAIEVKKGQCFTRSSDFKIGTLKTDETDFDASVQLYPNPTQINANIEMLNEYTGNIQLILVNQLGRIVHTTTLQKENGYLLYELPMANLPTGFYQIEITAVGELPVVRKIIVQ